jgi:hypothetical protein
MLLNKALPELRLAFAGVGEWKGADKYFEITAKGQKALGWNAPGRILVLPLEATSIDSDTGL